MKAIAILHPIYNKENGWSIHGPHKIYGDCPTIVLRKKNEKKKNLSYIRFLMECYLGRMLDREEKVFRLNVNSRITFDNLIIKRTTSNKLRRYLNKKRKE